MYNLKLYLQTILFLLAIINTHQQVQIKCYDCVTPLGVDDATAYCNASLYCKGVYCTKGLNALSNGVYHGCINSPPIDTAGATCKTVTNTMGTHENCYCKNIDFCNGLPAILEGLMLLRMVFYSIFIFFFF